jgi:hypothetical protein
MLLSDCFNSCVYLIYCCTRYFDPDPANYVVLLDNFRDVVKSYAPKTYASLLSIGALENNFLDLFFAGFFVELLPPDAVYRIMDNFLLEGSKVLYRYGLAIIKGYKAQIKANTFTTATNFWLAVKADAFSYCSKHNLVMLCKSLGVREALPAVDAFVMFSRAKNPEVLDTGALYEAAYDEDRSTLSKMLRPMNLAVGRRQSLSAVNSPAGTPIHAAGGRASLSGALGGGGGSGTYASVNANGATPPPPPAGTGSGLLGTPHSVRKSVAGGGAATTMYVSAQQQQAGAGTGTAAAATVTAAAAGDTAQDEDSSSSSSSSASSSVPAAAPVPLVAGGAAPGASSLLARRAGRSSITGAAGGPAAASAAASASASAAAPARTESNDADGMTSPNDDHSAYDTPQPQHSGESVFNTVASATPSATDAGAGAGYKAASTDGAPNACFADITAGPSP